MKSLIDYNDSVPMTEEQSKMFMVCTMSDMKGEELPEEYKSGPPFRIIQARLDIADAKVSPWVVIFFSSLCDRPGKLVMYAYACFELYQKKGDEVKMDDIANAFPMGFPSEKAMESCWDAQKMERGGNWLNTEEAWKSV